MESKRRPNKLQKFVSSLNGVLEGLPSESEKREIESGFLKLIGLLTDLKTAFEILPQADETEALRVALQRLQEVLSKADKDPVLAGLLGLARPQARTRQKHESPEEVLSATNTFVNELEALPLDDIRSRLEANVYPLTLLRSVASALGVSPNSKLNRDALVHQIAMRIANARGYQRLRGEIPAETSEPSSPVDAGVQTGNR